MSYHKDSRNENVELDYNNLKISCPTDFTNGFSEFNQNVQRLSGTVTNVAGNDNIVYTLGTTSGHSYICELIISGVCTASGSGNTGKAYYQVAYSGVVNNGGTLTISGGFGNMFAYNGLSAGTDTIANGSNLDFHVLNTSANDTLKNTWFLNIYKN